MANLFVWQTSARMQDGTNGASNLQGEIIGTVKAGKDTQTVLTASSGTLNNNNYKIESNQNSPILDSSVTTNVTPQDTKTPTNGNVCTPIKTVTEGNLFPGGIVSFDVSSGPGSVTVEHVNAGTGLQSLTVVGTPTNAIVNIPTFTTGTFDPVVVTFTPIVPGLAVDFTLRAASTFHAANISVRCGETCTPSTTMTEGDLLPGGIVTFGVWGGPGTVTVDYVDSGLGMKILTVVGVPVNAIVSIPPFVPGTYDPVVVTFTPIDPNLPVDFRLRAASSYYAVNIRARCAVLEKPD